MFLQPWWLDAIWKKDHWQVALAEHHHKIVAAHPYGLTKRWGFTVIDQPLLAPWQGFHLTYPAEVRPSARLAFEEKIIPQLYGQLPPVAAYFQRLNPALRNWQPLHWMGYRQTTRYTHVINDLANEHAVFERFESRAKHAIAKASTRLTVERESDPSILLQLMDLTYRKQRKKSPISPDLLNRLMQGAFGQNCGRFYVARDADGLVHAASFVVWSNGIAYDLVQGSHPAHLATGGISLVIWEAIRDASRHGLRQFDFTGSMMQGVAKFLRSFGAELQPFFQIQKTNALSYGCLLQLRTWIKR